MNNPYGADPRHALYPLPANSAGGRLYAMIAEATGLSMREYLEAFDRVNLVAGQWNVRDAAESAASLLPTLGGRSVVLLGRAVQRAFDVDVLGDVSERQRVACLVPRRVVTFYALPHPSGRNPWYNDPDNRAAAVALLAGLLRNTVSADD